MYTMNLDIDIVSIIIKSVENECKCKKCIYKFARDAQKIVLISSKYIKYKENIQIYYMQEILDTYNSTIQMCTQY
jgi:hypothetical protein